MRKTFLIPLLFSSICYGELKTSWDAVLDSTLKEKTKLVILSEYEHNSISIQNTNVKLIKKIKERLPQVNCLFVEFSSGEKDAFQKFVNGDSYEQTIIAAQESISEQVNLPIRYDLAPKSILNTGKDLNLKLIPVDINFLSKKGFETVGAVKNYYQSRMSEGYKKYLELYVEGRSIEMAKNIKSQFDNGTCSGGILIVGAFHMHKMLGGKNVISIDKKLSLEVEYQSYGVFSGDSCRSLSLTDHSTNMCLLQRENLDSNIGQKGSPTINADYNGGFLGKRSD